MMRKEMDAAEYARLVEIHLRLKQEQSEQADADHQSEAG